MPQFRFDSCVAFDGLTPEISIRKVTFEPSLDAAQADSGAGYLTVNSSFIETVEDEAQDTWFDDQEGQQYTSIRTLVSVDSNITKQLMNIIRAVTEQRDGLEGDLSLMSDLINGIHDFSEEEATQAAELLGLLGTHQMENGHFHPGQNHASFRAAVRRLAACIRALTSRTFFGADPDGSGIYGANERFSLTEGGRNRVLTFGDPTNNNLFVIEQSMRSLTMDEQFMAQMEKTINDDGAEVRVANMPRLQYVSIPLNADHLTVLSFAFIDTEALRQTFDETPQGERLDFTFTDVTTAIVQSNVFITPLSETAEEALSPDTTNLSPQSNIFEDLRGVFALSNRTLDTRSGYTNERESNGVNLSDFEDEIRSMSVDVDEGIQKALSRNSTVFSDLWSSRRRDDAIDLSFVFNERLFLKQSSVFPKLYQNETFALLADGLGGGVSRIRVYKQQVNSKILTNDNSLSTSSRASLLLGRDQEKEYISTGLDNEMLINDFSEDLYFGSRAEGNGKTRGLMFLTCTDYDNQDARNVIGKTFQYGVEIDYVDPTVDMVLKMTNGLLEQAQNIQDIIEDLVNQPSSDPDERRRLHGSTTERLNNIMRRWVPLMDALASIDIISGAGSIQDYVNRMAGTADQTVYERAESIGRIVDIFQFYGSELEIELRKAVPGIEVYPGDDSPESANYASSGGSGTGSTSRSINTIEYRFNNILPADQGAGYDYLRYEEEPTINPGLEIVSLTDYLNRCDIETEKYFTNPGSVKGANAAKVKYFTPSVILNPLGQSIVQVGDNIRDYNNYANFTAGMISYKNQKDNMVAVNKSSLGQDIGLDTAEIFLQELQSQGVTVEYNTDRNRNRDQVNNRSPFSKIGLGNSKQEQTESNQSDLLDRDENLRSRRGEEQETRDVQSDDRDVKKALANLLGPMSLSTNNSGTQQKDKANSFTKVVLKAPEETFEDISLFPNQLKAMVSIVLSKFNDDVDEYINYNYDFEEIRQLVGSNNQQTDLTDPMRDYSRYAAYWLNYKQLARVEILSGFSLTAGGQINISSANWREISVQDINSLPVRSIMLCRFSSALLALGDLGDMLGLSSPSGLDLPTYNQYFLLTRTDEEEGVSIIEEDIQIEEAPQQLQTFEPTANQQQLESFILSPEPPQIGDRNQIARVLERFGNNVVPKLDVQKVFTPPPVSMDQAPQNGMDIITPKRELREEVVRPPVQQNIPARTKFEDLLDNIIQTPRDQVRETRQVAQRLQDTQPNVSRQQSQRRGFTQARQNNMQQSRLGQNQARNFQRTNMNVNTPMRNINTNNFGGGGGY